MNNYFIILAAGESKRFNSNIPKPYYIYKGKPLIVHSIDKAKKYKRINKIVLVVNKKHLNHIKKLNIIFKYVIIAYNEALSRKTS